MRRTRAPFKVAALFAGIGGIEVGFEKSGHQTRLICEKDAAANEVLCAHFKRVRGKYPQFHDDVASLESLPTGVNLVTAGFPCQDLSQAGRTKGIGGTQSGLVDHVFRLLESNDIPWLVLENVPFMLQLDRGEALRYLIRRLESNSLGYRWAYRVLDSRAFGLPQRRLRVFLVASKVDHPARLLFNHSVNPRDIDSFEGRACGFYWTEGTRGLGWAVDAIPTLKKGSTLGIPSPPAIWNPEGPVIIGTPDIRDAERLQGFDEDWTKPAEEVAGGRGHRSRWALVGNAVTTSVAEWVGRCLRERSGDLPETTSPLGPKDRWPIAAFGGPGTRARAVLGCSTWPVEEPRTSLAQFLAHDLKPLSPKATLGFFKRLTNSRLKRPVEFEEALRTHYRNLTGEELQRPAKAHAPRPRAGSRPLPVA